MQGFLLAVRGRNGEQTNMMLVTNIVPTSTNVIDHHHLLMKREKF